MGKHVAPEVVAEARTEGAKTLKAFYDKAEAEGFDKVTLFGILDTLLEGSQALLESARAQLVADKGESAGDPWNTGFLMAGLGFRNFTAQIWNFSDAI